MTNNGIDLVSLLEKSLSEQPQESFEEIGHVIKVGDGVCRVFGLVNAVYGELISFEGGNQGIALDLDEDFVSVVLLDNTIPVTEQEVAHRTAQVFCVPVGEEMLGRVVNAKGAPIDACGPLNPKEHRSIEQMSPGITARMPVHESLETGITVIDALIPIGKGQRELIIGNRNTGKTTLALDTILNQRDKNVICVYVSIGHKQSTTAKIINVLERADALKYCIIVDADAKETAINQYLAPYTGCTIAEYFMHRGRDVLIVYDDLSNHAIAYRELSLLLRRPPGREAFPGDIFYIHSRLLERAGKLSPALGSGSLTALPIIQTQGDDLSAYIPTNLISITDGQVFLDTNLFNNGIRPAANIGLSVSRVGGAAQTRAMKSVAGSLKLELAQYDELQEFAQFGSELDRASQRALDRGRRALELLKQPAGETYSLADQVIFLLLLKENILDDLPIATIKQFSVQCASFIKSIYPDLYGRIQYTKELSREDTVLLSQHINEFKLAFPKHEPVSS